MLRFKTHILLTFLGTTLLILQGCGQKGALVKTQKDSLLIDKPFAQKNTPPANSLNVASVTNQ